MQRLIVSLGLTLLCALTACRSGGKSAGGPSESAQARNPLVPHQFGPNYKYNELMIKDYDEMLAMVQDMVKKAHAATSREDTAGEGEAVEWYGRALKLIFSRPDSDNMVAKLVNEVRRDLQGFNAYEDTIDGLADEGIKNAVSADNPLSVQSSALVLLENILAEVRPAAESGNPEMLRIVERIAAADIRVSSEVKKDRRLRGMFLTKNPTDEAKAILKKIAESKKKKK